MALEMFEVKVLPSWLAEALEKAFDGQRGAVSGMAGLADLQALQCTLVFPFSTRHR